MIETLKEYRESRGITLEALAEQFGATTYQDAQSWEKSGWVVITEKNGAARIMSPKRVRVR